MLERLVYRSKATGEVGSLALFNLLTQARQKNAELNITGHLIFDGEFFTQWIEGPSSSLDQLWTSLQKDDRHQQIMLISRTPTEARRFAAWTMAFSSYPSLNSHNMPGFFPVDENSVAARIQDLTH
jgi:Sensors of blue-light using FAD